MSRFIEKSAARALVDRAFRVAYSALCHCDDNAEGAFPKNCDCEQTKKQKEAIELLLNERKYLLKIIDEEK